MMLRVFAFLLIFGTLAGCETTAPPATSSPVLTFDHLQDINLNVAAVDVRNVYQPPMDAPNVEHLLKTPTFEAVPALLAETLVTQGHSKTLVLTINEASVIRENVPTMGGIKGLFTREPQEKYQGVIDVKIELLAASGQRVGVGFVNATHTSYVKEGASIARRQQTLTDLNDALLHGFYEQMRDTMWHKFSGLVL